MSRYLLLIITFSFFSFAPLPPLTQDLYYFYIENKQVKEITLDKHFKNNKDLSSRNSAILKALKDGYTQADVARYLNISSALVTHTPNLH
jgi:ATP/maltotriose-dependent transcriptional regulator MalT